MNQPTAYAHSDGDLLLKTSTTASARSKFEDWGTEHRCDHPAHTKHRWNWLSITVLVLSIYSTVLAGLFLIVGLVGPRYGRIIRSNSSFTLSDASVVVGLLAKTVELSFVTCFVAFLGQALARRANSRSRTGVTLAELSMRQWIMQPGTLVTHWESVRYAGPSILGVLSFVATIMAVLYTTACNGLVLPQLKFGKWQQQAMQGRCEACANLTAGIVKTSFANPIYIQNICETPIGTRQDRDDAGRTCIQIEHAAMAYHNYFSYMGHWSQISKNGTGSTDLAYRPPGYALVNDNTTVTAPWVERNNTNATQIYEQTGIVVNNVTMAMPHAGVLKAAVDPINGIVQPEELDGQGVYSLRASVPSPIVNVMCATLNYTQLKPFVYELWDEVDQKVLNVSTWPLGLAYPDPFLTDKLVGNPLVELFRWNATYDPYGWPPVFPKAPPEYNTLVNDTANVLSWGRKSIYILARSGNHTNTDDPLPSPFNDPTLGGAYSLCKLQVGLTPNCSTRYNASSSGGTLEALCENPDDDMRYVKSLSNATYGNASLAPDWPNIASEWSRSLSLNNGFLGANASNARLLTQLIVIPGWSGQPALSGFQPSMAEALAVMAGCTLIQSSKDAPFVEFWNYTSPNYNILDPGQYQYFNASIRAQQFASGGVDGSQKGWFLVLFSVFIINLLILIYFSIHRHWYPDFSEPQNLFNIAVNSPPSDHVSCGGNPHGQEYKVPWKLNTSNTGHIYIENNSEGEPLQHTLKRRVSAFTDKMSESPLFSPRSWRKGTSPTFERQVR
ncbi:hypothetical protein K431DRAFT_225055 [Polychaeton citri CBS 116435]|uniref:Mcm2 3 5 family protein n=1 Tax=Polychaeton citri CBS 116435 TaxID=1314669 RepID=A0A9P4QAB3_9PEZI|nr:hypothetical protein K431DRAFT_225055 [Polychaeton citri CBS 116435]